MSAPGHDNDDISGLHVFDGNIHRLAVTQDTSSFCLQSHEFLNGFARLPLRLGFQPLAEEYERDEEGSNLEVEIMHFSDHRPLSKEITDKIPQAVDIGGGCADGDEAVHIERTH